MSTTPPPPPGYNPYNAAVLPENYASFGARFGAMFIDDLVMAAISLPFWVGGVVSAAKATSDCTKVSTDTSVSITCDGSQINGGWLVLAIGLFTLAAIVALVLYCKKVASGQSWGHKAMGIRIVGSDTGQSISAGKVFARQICRIFSQLFCLLGYFWMLWDPRKQTWHDKMVGTVVVKA